jgi:hypothetical protein
MEVNMEQIEHKGYTIKIEPDMEPMDPREWDNLGHMVCAHRKYTLGDKHDISVDDFKSWEELHDYLIKDRGAVVILPLCILDHSGVWMHIGSSFACDPGGWDTSHVGFIYVTKEDIRKEWNIKRITAKKLKWAEDILRSEVKIYNAYLSGDVYGYIIESPDGQEVDSCWGFYNVDDTNYAEEEAKSMIDCIIRTALEKHTAHLKVWIKHKIPLIYRKPLNCRA